MEFLKDPLLFLIYINDLPSVSKSLAFYLFGDDTNIYFEASDLFTLQKVLNCELRHVKKWLDANKLSLNIDKTNFVVFHSPARKLTEPTVLKFGRKRFHKQIASDSLVFFLMRLQVGNLILLNYLGNCPDQSVSFTN